MLADFWLVLRWWGVLFLVGAAAYPLTKRLFASFEKMNSDNSTDGRQTNWQLLRHRGWWDEGYLFSKAVGMAVVTYLVYLAGTAHILPFSSGSIFAALAVVFLAGVFLSLKDKGNKGNKGNRVLMIFAEELLFFSALLFWSWIKGHEPSIRGLEKFMDFGFMKSILDSQFFPASDMWFAGHSINYYYFGHIVTAVLTKLSGIDLVYTFNLMLATIFALTLTMSFSIGVQLWGYRGDGGNEGDRERRLSTVVAGMLTAFLVTLSGNLQTLYAFTKGYTGDNVKPFWELLWGIRDIGRIRDIGEKIGQGMQTYWYANATRFIPFTIHEFPSYSFVVSDVHGHVLSIPVVLLAIGLLIVIHGGLVSREKFQISLPRRQAGIFKFQIIFYGFLVGVLLMTNALDGPIYLGLLAVVLGVQSLKSKVQSWKIWGVSMFVVLLIAGLTSLPFLVHFKSFVNGIAVNCPPAFLANTKIGPLIFETVEKCQHSPIWMMAILWGFFIYCGVALILKRMRGIRGIRELRETWSTKYNHIERLLIVFFLFSVLLIIFPEFFYFKDIYPMHFRSNTMFKLGYQAFILFSIVAGYTIVAVLKSKVQSPKFKALRMLFFIFLVPQLFLVSIFPIFSVRSYFNGLKKYEGIYGLNWLAREYPTDYSAIEWLNNQNVKCSLEKTRDRQMSNVKCDRYAIVEADGDSYTDYGRFSAFAGVPTVVGWAVHEWLWRGSYDVVAPRREEVRKIYESTDLDETKNLITTYYVRYVIIGTLERTKFKSLQEWKFGLLGKKVFQSGETVIYHIGT